MLKQDVPAGVKQSWEIEIRSSEIFLHPTDHQQKNDQQPSVKLQQLQKTASYPQARDDAQLTIAEVCKSKPNSGRDDEKKSAQPFEESNTRNRSYDRLSNIFSVQKYLPVESIMAPPLTPTSQFAALVAPSDWDNSMALGATCDELENDYSINSTDFMNPNEVFPPDFCWKLNSWDNNLSTLNFQSGGQSLKLRERTISRAFRAGVGIHSLRYPAWAVLLWSQRPLTVERIYARFDGQSFDCYVSLRYGRYSYRYTDELQFSSKFYEQNSGTSNYR